MPSAARKAASADAVEGQRPSRRKRARASSVPSGPLPLGGAHLEERLPSWPDGAKALETRPHSSPQDTGWRKEPSFAEDPPRQATVP